MSSSLLILVSATSSVAGVAVAAAAAIADFKGRLRRRASEEESIRFLVGTADRVKNTFDPIRLGVHLGLSRGDGSDRLTPYVRRDIDGELRQALASPGFVLVVGDAAVGKTRSAYEALRATLPEHIIIAPNSKQEIRPVIDAAMVARRSVLWLDDLESYMSPKCSDGLSAEQVRRIVGGEGHHRVILATIRSSERESLISSDSAATAVLARAKTIVLQRTLSPEEQISMLSLGDPRLDEAANSGTLGVTQYLTLAPQLLKQWNAAWAAGSHPRGVSLVAAAVDLRRVGFTSPLPRELLEELVDYYLSLHGGEQLKPESIEDAWRWASRTLSPQASLLTLVDEGRYEVFDYLTYVTPEHSMTGEQNLDKVATVALPFSDATDATKIAEIALRNGSYELAEVAIRRALAIQNARGHNRNLTLASRNILVEVLYSLGRLSDAETEGRSVIEDEIRVLGENHPSTLASQRMLTQIQSDSRSAQRKDALQRLKGQGVPVKAAGVRG